jgi:hypothetical protein
LASLAEIAALTGLLRTDAPAATPAVVDKKSLRFIFVNKIVLKNV